ncbi:MAG: trypsin-like serine protease [Thermoguttaceae bacterium]|nr:trypsin-like serine protease [Thermoguttaceae bacterium]
MSLSRKNKVWGVADLLTGRFAKKRIEKAREQKPTKLLIDQLEERQLLSLTVGTTDNILVNDGWQDVRGEVAVDSNNAGDVIVAWTGADRLKNPAYDATDPESSPYLLDENGEYVEDLNIYASYLTDEVQIITIPQELVPGSKITGLNGETKNVQSGSFELVYNAYETQRFSIYKSSFAGNGAEDVYPTSNSISTFNLGFYAEGELTWILFEHDAALTPSDNAAKLQETIRAIPGGEYSEAVVVAVSETDFDITFGTDQNFRGQNVSDIKVRNDYYNDMNGLLEKVRATDFDVSDLRSCTTYQKLILKNVFGDRYQQAIEQTIATQGKKAVVKTLQTKLDAQSDELASGVVTTVDEVRNITSYSSKTGASIGITVSSDPWTTAKNIQNAFNAVKGATLYAPVTRGYIYDEATHTYTYVEEPSRAYSSDQAYGTMQAKIPAIEVSVVPVAGTTNQFQITFTGANGLQNEDALIVSAATYATRSGGVSTYETLDGEWVAETVKENSSVFRVNSAEVAEFVVDEEGYVVTDREGETLVLGTGRTNQSKPDVAMSADGSFVVAWENEVADVAQPYNSADIMARRFVVQGYAAENTAAYDKLNFYANGAEGGKLGYLQTVENENGETETTFVADPFALADAAKVQCVAPVANEFVVNASTNGRQTDPTIAADKDGAFIVAWTSEAQDASYFGGVYARQFDSLAQPVTGDITLASSQIGTNYYGPADAAMSDDGYAVVAWGYNDWQDTTGASTLYHSVLEPQSAKFIVDHEVVAEGAYGASVAFAYSVVDEKTGDYAARFGIAYNVQGGVATGGDDATANALLDETLAGLPTVRFESAVYEITGNVLEEEEAPTVDDNNNNTNTGENEDDTNISDEVIHVGSRETSSFTSALVAQQTATETAGDRGNPSIALDADGDVFIAYQGFVGLADIQSMRKEGFSALDYVGYTADSEELAIQLAWSDFDKANLVYENKAIQYQDGKIAYEDKNEDLAKFVKLALGWGYDVDGELVEFGAEPVYTVANVDCIDVDVYERRFLAVAQKEGATAEQLTRLHAVLEALLSPLRNNGNDVNLRLYGQKYYSGDNQQTEQGDAAVVSNLRDGSNACFYLAFPNRYVASATTSLVIGRQDNAENNEPTNAETIAIDLSGQYDADYGYIADPLAAAQAVADALNASELAAGQPASFVVRYVPLSEVEFYKGTLGELDIFTESFEYSATVTIDDVEQVVQRSVDDYFVLQIVAQHDLHDTPLYIGYEDVLEPTTVKLMNQTVEDMNYAMSSSLFVERNGSLGTAQTNPALASTASGDLTVAWGVRSEADPRNAYNTYPNVGNPIDAAFTHIYVRNFVESTDNAGPTVVNVSLPNGDKVQEGEMVTSALRDVVVSFSENMLTVGDGTNAYNRLHAVDNVANWTLLRDGVEVTGAIESVSFGLNASQSLAQNTVDENGNPVEEINDGLLANGTNRWEAVISFAEGCELSDGNYSLVCSSMVQDVARNAIYSQGYAVDGSGAGFDGRAWSLDFSVTRLNEALGFEYGDSFARDNYIPEDYIEYDPSAPSRENGAYGPVVYNDFSSLRQVTRSSILNETSDYGPNTAQAVASNANGDFVATWVETLEQIDEETGVKTVTQTVWAKAYRALYVMNKEGVREQVIDQSVENVVVKVYEATAEYEASTNKKGETVYTLVSATSNGEAAEVFADPRQASVAIDDRGEFVVVWDMITDGEEADGSRDVYMAKYAFNGGQMKLNGKTEALRVNVETDKDQQYAAVAMDADGDVVVVWESYGQDGSGWGVFGRRFMTNGLSYGYANTIQTLSFSDSVEVQGDALKLTGEVDDQAFEAVVQLSVEMKTNAERIKDALVGTGFFAEKDLDVVVSGAGEISIEFKGDYTATYVDLIDAEWTREGQTDRSLICNVEMRQLGATGKEFEVNETTENNQRFASIAMERDGAFVVSWTSWGQDGDSAIESNIYARKFASNHVISNPVGSVEDMTIAADGTSKVISTDDIDSHEVYGGGIYDSVGMITVGGDATNGGTGTGTGTNGDSQIDAESLGTGSLLTTGMHVLTAAHVVTGDDGTPIDPSETQILVTFHTANGTVSIPVAEVYVHETYDGETGGAGVDLAILQLATAAPRELEGYELYTGSDEIGQTVTFVGYGTYGEADDAENDAIGDRGIGVKHQGQNVYELDGSNFQDSENPNVLVYDFDDGTAANDYLGNYYGIYNRGLGDDEAITAPGDSGGPTFINGQIAGVCSWGTDFDGDESFGPGNYQVDVRVSAYVDWVNEIILGGLGAEFLVNTDLAVAVIADEDDANNNNNNTEDETLTTLDDAWTQGSQIWSSVAMDSKGNFVVTWTGYNQDGNGDSLTGASNNGLGGVFGRVFSSDPESSLIYGGEVFQVNEYTAYDQIHSQVAMASNGDFVVVYESYQDPSNDENSDVADNFGIYARRYELVEGETITVETGATNNNNNNNNNNDTTTEAEEAEIAVLEQKPIGSEFRVTRDDYYAFDKDQLGGSVAVDANGDMVFVWTDLSEPRENVDAVVRMRALTLPEDDIPPYVVRANAAYTNAAGEELQVSLYNNNVTFATGYAPTALVYSFSEYMYSAQMNLDIKKDAFDADSLYAYSDAKSTETASIKSVLNVGNWSMTRNGQKVTTDYIADIVYGYNASTLVEDYVRNLEAETGEKYYVSSGETRTNSYELVIIFRKPLPDGTYAVTLSDKVADAFSNRLDGDYDGESGGAFTVRFNVGVATSDQDDERVPETDMEAYVGALGGNGEPIVVSNQDGFIIVTESQVLYELGSTGTGNNNNNNNNNNNGTSNDEESEAYGFYETVVIDGTTYRIQSDVVMRRFNADGSADGVETRVNTYSIGNQIHPDIALTEGGSYVVSWVGESEDALNGVCARFYPGGAAQPKQVQIAGRKGIRCWNTDVQINEATGLVLITWIQGSTTREGADKVCGVYYDVNGEQKSEVFTVAENGDQSVESFDVESAMVDGKLQYVVAWTVADPDTLTREVYQRAFVANYVGGEYVVEEIAGKTRVNENTTRGQYTPQIAIVDEGPDAGKYYVVWVSDQTQANGADIYARAYNADGSAASFLGKTGEALVNTTVAHRQHQPSVDANEYGVVFAWTSFDAEEFNYDPDLREDRHDDGICVRVFNAAGQPVNVANDRLALGAVVGSNEGEFVLNGTTAGYQTAPSVAIFDWELVDGVYAPKFVVAWQGPNLNAGEAIEDEEGTTNNNNNANHNNNNKNNNGENAGDAYIGPYSTFYKLISAGGSASQTGDATIVSSKSERFTADVSKDSGSNGFYRPVDSGELVLAAGSGVSSTLKLNGTSGDDEIVVETAANGVATIKINGKTQTVPTGTTAIVVDGLGGNDSIVYKSASANDVAVDATNGAVRIFGSVSFAATNVESATLNGAGGTLSVSATANGDYVELGAGSAKATSAKGFELNAEGFANVSALGGGVAAATLVGTSGDDVVSATASTVATTGVELKNFASVRIDGGAGDDVAKIDGATSLNASENAVVASTASSTIVAFGFETVEAKGVGSATANVYGSRGDDSVLADAAKTEMVYAAGTVLRASGFDTTNVFGNGGADRASLFAGSGLNTFEGRATQASLTGGSFARNLNGFSNVAVFGSDEGKLIANLYDTFGDDAFALAQDSATMDVDGANLYSILAVDQVKVKREAGRGDDSIEEADALDYLFSTENWDF